MVGDEKDATYMIFDDFWSVYQAAIKAHDLMVDKNYDEAQATLRNALTGITDRIHAANEKAMANKGYTTTAAQTDIDTSNID